MRPTNLQSEHIKMKQFFLIEKIRAPDGPQYLLLATKPNYTRERVGCPSDTRTLKTNSKCQLKLSSL